MHYQIHEPKFAKVAEFHIEFYFLFLKICSKLFLKNVERYEIFSVVAFAGAQYAKKKQLK